MNKNIGSIAIKTGLAIFAMLFGAGNLIFPTKIGILSGNNTIFGLVGFLITGVLIPLAGLIAMVFYDGSYRDFFYRIGKMPGAICIFLCMLIIGPLYAIPRIIAFSYEVMRPFIGQHISLLMFSLGFAGITFLCSYKKSSLIDLIGKILSPIILVTLGIIFIFGYLNSTPIEAGSIFTAWETFSDSLVLGYNTLDLLGTIFFGYIVLSILHEILDKETLKDPKSIAKIMFISSGIAAGLLGLVYAGMAYLGNWHGAGFELLDEGKMFINTLLRILGNYGALFIGTAVFFACLTTIIALASVVSEYIKNDVTNERFSYAGCLAAIIAISTLLAQFELGPILVFATPFIKMFYPIIIVLTFCNIAYKLWGFKPVKIPVLATLLISCYFNGPAFLETVKISAGYNQTNQQA